MICRILNQKALLKLSFSKLGTSICLAAWVAQVLFCVPVYSATPHIINGSTPEDSDDAPCSEAQLYEYVNKAKKAIQTKWHPIKGFEDRNVAVVFSVLQNGTIEEAKIVESSGSQEVDKSALDALKLASPLEPLPKGAPEYIQIRYVFSWHVSHNYKN